MTVIQPGMICGAGGRGFGMVTSQAKRSFAVTLGGGGHKMRSIALGDLVYYLVGVLKEPRAFGQCFDVGCDDTYTIKQMIDIAADVFGRKPPRNIPVPLGLLSALAPLIEGHDLRTEGRDQGICGRDEVRLRRRSQRNPKDIASAASVVSAVGGTRNGEQVIRGGSGLKPRAAPVSASEGSELWRRAKANMRRDHAPMRMNVLQH